MSINSEHERQCQNTDRELWRETEGDFYAPSIHVTQDGKIRIKVGGLVITKSLREWHALAVRAGYGLGPENAAPASHCVK